MTPEPAPLPAADEVLGRFSEATRAWFTGAFAAPTPAQLGAWDAVSRGQHALVVAPTGSGKTLSAFLWALDGLAGEPVPEDKDHRCRVLYVSPLKALAVDVERNLRSPLTGIRQAAQRLGLPVPEVRVGVRSGDTPAEERRAFTRTPPDVLITTPESLFLLLTSKAREQLRGVRTVVLDEVHAMAGSKRGAHLALSLERLDALVQAAGGEPTQRVGLSATVRPVQTVAEWVSGGPPGDRRAAAVDEGVRPPRRRPRRGHERAGRLRARGGGPRRPQRPGLGRRPPGQHLAARRGAHRRPRRRAPLHAGVRQLPAALRAADRAAQRGLGRAAEPRGARRRRNPPHPPRQLMGQAGATARRAGDPRPRPPRLGLQGAALPHRGGPQGRAACPRSSRPPASSSASTWAPSTSSSRSSPRPAWPAGCSGWAAPVTRSGRSRAGCCSRSSAATCCRPPWSSNGCATVASRSCTSRRTRWTCSPSRSWRWSPWTSGRCPTCSPWRSGPPPSRRCRARCSTRSWTCCPAATPATSSPSCARAWCGTASPRPSPDAPGRSASR